MSVATVWRERFESRWSTLGPRDRRALRLGGIALAVLLPVIVAWSVHEALAARRAAIDASSMTLEPQTDGQLRLGLRDAPYESVTGLLAALARWEGITVVSADIARTAPGRVEASLVLRAP